MMGTSREYAAALFDLAKESAIEAELSEGLKFLKEVFESTPEYAAFLTSPSIPKQKRLDTIQNIFASNLPEYAVSFLSLLCEHGNISILGECAYEYEKLYAESCKISHAVAVSVVELTADEKEKLRAKLEKMSGNKVDIQYKVDSTLLGGMKVSMDDMCLDGSLRQRLNDIRKVMGE